MDDQYKLLKELNDILFYYFKGTDLIRVCFFFIVERNTKKMQFIEFSKGTWENPELVVANLLERVVYV